MKWFKSSKEAFLIPIHGTIHLLERVPDAVFAQKLLGDGFAIEPSDEITEVRAPVSGVLSVCFPTHHAYGIQTSDGIEILLHLGIDTVTLSGRGFTCHVVQGQKIKQGDLLCSMDLKALRAEGKPTICPIVITSGEPVTLHLLDQVVSLLQPDVVSIGT